MEKIHMDSEKWKKLFEAKRIKGYYKFLNKFSTLQLWKINVLHIFNWMKKCHFYFL